MNEKSQSQDEQKIKKEVVVRFHNPYFMYEIGDDADGLDLLEVKYIEFVDNKPIVREQMTFSPEFAKAIGSAMIELAEKKLTKSAN